MARIRTIKPEFWTDESVVELSAFARLLVIGLLNFADDEGWLWDKPRTLKLQIFPADDVDVHALIDEVVGSGIVQRFATKDGRGALHIHNFTEHQKVSHPTPSKIAPEVETSRPLQRIPERSRDLPTPPEDSGTFAPEGKGREGNRDKPTSPAAPDRFIEFWDSYPVRFTPSGAGTKGSRKNALDAWKKLSDGDRAAAIAALPAYISASNGYPKDAERYLKHRAWEGLAGQEEPWDGFEVEPV